MTRMLSWAAVLALVLAGCASSHRRSGLEEYWALSSLPDSVRARPEAARAMGMTERQAEAVKVLAGGAMVGGILGVVAMEVDDPFVALDLARISYLAFVVAGGYSLYLLVTD